MFWGIEDNYEAQAEAEAASQSDSAPYEYTESAAEESYRQQLEQQQLEQIATGGEAAAMKTADVAAMQQIKTDNTGMIIAIGAVAVGLFFLMKSR